MTYRTAHVKTAPAEPTECTPANAANVQMAARLTCIVLSLLLALLFLAGCGEGLSDAVKTRADAVRQNLTATRKFIESRKEKYADITKKTAFSALAGYAEKEAWAGAFTRADATLDRAKEHYDKGLRTTVKQNRHENETLALAQIKQVNAIIQDARHQATEPFRRISSISTAMLEARKTERTALTSADAIRSKVNALAQGPVARARKTFPASEEKITARFSPFIKMASDTAANATIVKVQYAAHEQKQADYAAMATAADAIEAAEKRLSGEAPILEKDIARLYRSYTRILEDMKIDYFITLHRESWNDRSDAYTSQIYAYNAIQVSPAVFQAFTRSKADAIAELKPGAAGKRLQVNRGLASEFKSLKLDLTEAWPDPRHNVATFYLYDTRPACFHKYLEEENGKTSKTGWEMVNSSFYEQNLENLGMAILSKSYGEFEPDTQAAPPGMAYVGNPEYGEWKKDESGNSFWSWYGKYAFFSSLFFFPPHNYSYGSWSRWRSDYRHKKPYYGQTRGGYTFGSRGTAISRSPRYQNTTFLKTGGLKTASASVRGGGSGLRGGGPRSKGK